MSLTKHLLSESFFLKWRFKDQLFLYILKEIAERYDYDTNRWLDMSMTVWERDKSLKLQEILKKTKLKKLMEILEDYIENVKMFDNITGNGRRELKQHFGKIYKQDKYTYVKDPDKEVAERIFEFL